MSLAILKSDTANVFRVALNCTRSSCAPWTVNLFGAVTKGSPVSWAIWAATSLSKPG